MPPGDDDELIIRPIGDSPQAEAVEPARVDSSLAADEAEQIDAAAGLAPSEHAQATDSVASIRAGLASGAISPDQARAELIRNAVQSALPPDASPELVASLASS